MSFVNNMKKNIIPRKKSSVSVRCNDNSADTVKAVIFDPDLLSERPVSAFYPAGFHAYHYKHFSICLSYETSNGHPYRTVSFAPHGINLMPLEGSELDGILTYFGFLTSMPMENWVCRHVGEPFFGDTQYFKQQVMDVRNQS